MKKIKILYAISILLVILFVVITIIDYSKYDVTYSAPFTIDVLIRTLEFLLPSIVVFIIARFVK